MQSQHAVINPDDDWMKVIAENTVTEDARAECISRLSTYLYTSYRFETGKGIFSASGLKRVSEDILRGATHVIAWVLMSLENPDSPLIIHEKKEFFQVVKIISNLLITMGLPADNIVFVKDPNMEKDNFHSDDDPDYLLPHQLFNVKRKFLDGKTKAIGKPHSKSRIIIPLNYHFNGWIEDRYRTVIANYLKIFECEQKEDTSPRLEGVAALKNISLFFGMYTGYDSNAELPADIMSDTLEGEQKALAIVPGQLLKVERASQFAKTEYYQQAECLINNILINKFDLLKDYFAKDIAEYFTLEGTPTLAKKIFLPLISHDPSAPSPVPTSPPILTSLTFCVISKIENLRKDKEKLANHYAQFISFVFLNYGIGNPYPLFEAQLRSNREALRLRVDLNKKQQKTVFENYGIFLDKYINQKYLLKNRSLLEKKSNEPTGEETVPSIEAVPSIVPQPYSKSGYVSEATLSALQHKLFQPRHVNKQVKELVGAVVQLSKEFTEEKPVTRSFTPGI